MSKELINVVNKYKMTMRIIYNKDCSEYVQDFIEYYGKGVSYTVRPKSAFETLNFIYFGEAKSYVYHTVVKIGSTIIDVTNNEKPVMSLVEYNKMLSILNPNKSFRWEEE